MPESVRLKRGGNETLAVCPGCAMTENLEVGAHDFMEDIEDASISASRHVVVFSLHSYDSCPSDEAEGGLFFEFE